LALLALRLGRFLVYWPAVVGLPGEYDRTALKKFRFAILLMLLWGSMAAVAFSQFDRRPDWDHETHMVGKLWTVVNNNGVIGNINSYPLPYLNKIGPSFYYPRYSRTSYGDYIGLWLGGVVGRDTLVSTVIDELGQMEFFPDEGTFGQIEVQSIDPSSDYYNEYASAEEQFSIVYTDTFQYQSFVPYNSYDARSHRPLNVAVTQTTYAWSPSYAEDFIIVDYALLNLSDDTIHSCWAGIYYHGTVWNRGELPYPIPDDLEGYVYSVPYEYEELGDELIRAAYVFDKDGKVVQFDWDLINSCTHTFGVAPLHLPHGCFRNNFNWWNNQYGTNFNWGPRKADTDLYPFRSFFGGLGMPLSDRNKYYLMSKPELDYNGIESAINHSNDGWLPPNRASQRIAYGHEPQYVTSFGPFILLPHQGDTITFVISIGEGIHTNKEAYDELFDVFNPYPFEEYLKLDNLVNNVRWAKVVYDNPGIDTDNDGDSGKAFYYLDPVVKDTVRIFYEGDGVPDYRGATAPPAPNVRISTETGKITLRWNGMNTENFIDPMTLTKDFEGYRVYIARSDMEEEAVMLSSYDSEDYKLYKWNDARKIYEAIGTAYTVDSLRGIFGEDLQPLSYSYGYPLVYDGEHYYFEKIDYNVSDITNLHEIHKIYPEAVLDTADRDEEGRIRFYEWEYVIDNLLPTVPYWVAVTAFDFGHPGRSLEPMESSIERSYIKIFAQNQGEGVLDNGRLNVYVYPNPYRIDDGYYADGFENRLDETGPDKARNVYFANLPNKCTISIYSIDGDLIKRMEHDELETSGVGSTHRFDLVSRNREAIVTGLYIWVVESDYGTQMGKLVVLK